MTDKPKGNPNPSPATRFGAPKGNPNGKTAEQKRLEMQNAELAMKLRNRLLTALEGVFNENPEKETIIGNHLKNEVLKLLKDSEDRGLGAPVQQITSPDGSLGPTRIVIEAAPANNTNDDSQDQPPS